MQKAAETGYNSLFCITGFVYGAHQLGRLGTLLLPAASKAALLSAQLTEVHGALLPCAAAPFGLFSLAVYSSQKDRIFFLFALWGLSTGLAPLLPSPIGSWVDQVGKGVMASSLAYVTATGRGTHPGEENHARIQATLFSIAHLASMDLLPPLPGRQWIEPIAALSGIGLSLFLNPR